MVDATSHKPVIAAIDMGYGHLRAALPLADALGVPLLEMDRPPLGDERDFRFWERTRLFYEPLTRLSQLPALGPPLRALLEIVTAIPSPWPHRDLSAPTTGTRWMERAARAGVGAALAEHLKSTAATLLTTFYAAAILAELHGARELRCIVTDTDVNRVWAPPRPKQSRIRYYVPSEHARRRLLSYGVLPENVRATGFPLPHELVGGRERTALRRNLAARLARLGPRPHLRERAEAELGPLPAPSAPPLVVFAVGGAGAQTPIASQLARGVAREVRAEKLRLALVAGSRPEVAQQLRASLREVGLDRHPGAWVVHEADVLAYLRRFHALLAEADVLWSKPSEMTFFAALGLPFVSAPPVGVHEEWNRRLATEQGAALAQHDARRAGGWLLEWIEDGTLARAAWAGYLHLPSLGLYDILDELL